MNTTVTVATLDNPAVKAKSQGYVLLLPMLHGHSSWPEYTIQSIFPPAIRSRTYQLKMRCCVQNCFIKEISYTKRFPHKLHTGIVTSILHQPQPAGRGENGSRNRECWEISPRHRPPKGETRQRYAPTGTLFCRSVSNGLGLGD